MRWTIGGLLFGALWAAPALASSTPTKPEPAPVARPVAEISELALPDNANPVGGLPVARSDPLVGRGWERGFKPEKFKYTPPQVSTGSGNGGPVLAAGALGARRKGVPKLAHVVLSWDF